MKRIWIKRGLIVLIILGIVSLGAALTINGHVRGSAGAYLLAPQEAAALEGMDCILVLGCGIRDDGSPSLMLRDRLETGIDLYTLGAAPKLLMSGDHSREDYDEVGVMKNYAMAADVPSQDIFMDHAGFSTYESMYRARDIFQANKVIVVPQGYHLYRAVYDARALGLEAWGVAAEDIRYLGQTGRELREILARNKDWLWCQIQPEPTFLGEVIDIRGNGDLSNG